METRPAADVLVGAVMRSPVMTVERDASLRKAAGVLRETNVGTLAVVAGPEIGGILSERDVTRALADGADPDEVWVADVMSEEPRYVTAGDRVHTARDVMLAAGVRHLPVVEEGELVGIVSMRDLLAASGMSVVDEGDRAELRDLLDGTLGDLSSEIADTDNPSYRAALRRRRERLERVRAALDG